jgi:hypothetical protein
MDINSKNKSEQLNEDEVISNSVRFLNLSNTFNIKELVEVFTSRLQEKSVSKLFNNGLEIEVLRLGAKGWRKGIVRFRLEFIPNEPEIEEILESEKISQQESPLDDIRRMIS